RHAIGLEAATGAGVYFVHTSARDGVQAVMEARANGLPIYAETLHHYACFSAEDYKLPRGFCYQTYPSLKHRDDQKALWDGLVNDGVSTTATDEYPTSLELKLRGKEIDDVTGGNLGAEARMGIIYTEGVVKPGMTLQRFSPDRPVVQEDPQTRRFPRERLQSVGRMGSQRMARHNHPAWQGHRREGLLLG